MEEVLRKASALSSAVCDAMSGLRLILSAQREKERELERELRATRAEVEAICAETETVARELAGLRRLTADKENCAFGGRKWNKEEGGGDGDVTFSPSLFRAMSTPFPDFKHSS